MNDRNYAVELPGGTTTEHELQTTPNSTSTQIVFNGRDTGVITIRVKVYGSDEFEAPENNTIDLSAKKSWYVHNAPIKEVELSDAGTGAYNVVFRQWKP
jgi:hypothetical protein